MPEPTVPLSLRVTPEQFRALDEHARASGRTRSDLVRALINDMAHGMITPTTEPNALARELKT